MEAKVAETIAEEKLSFVVCRNSQGLEIRATMLRFTRYSAAFEIYIPSLVLRTSEVLSDFRIILNNSTVYSGKAVISNLVNAGEILICEVTLDDHWTNILPAAQDWGTRLDAEFKEYLEQWQKTYKVLPEFKVVVADMGSLLADLRLWLDQVELAIRSSPNDTRIKLEKETAHELATPVLSAIDALGDRFEEIAGRLGSDLRPVHIHFTRRNLHSLLLCSPFSYRTFYKPLGYAGDYEMVNMILRSPYEGGSLFAKVINAWFLNQLPAQAHRNRIQFLKRKLIEETARITRLGRPARIFNLGCGPAHEIQEFLSESELCEKASFTLLDFNEETIQYTNRALQGASDKFARKTTNSDAKKISPATFKRSCQTQD